MWTWLGKCRYKEPIEYIHTAAPLNWHVFVNAHDKLHQTILHPTSYTIIWHSFSWSTTRFHVKRGTYWGCDHFLCFENFSVALRAAVLVALLRLDDPCLHSRPGQNIVLLLKHLRHGPEIRIADWIGRHLSPDYWEILGGTCSMLWLLVWNGT